MRKYIRDQVVELLSTVWEGIRYATNTQSEQRFVVLDDCMNAVHSIAETLKAGLSEERFAFYENILEDLHQNLKDINSSLVSQLSPAQEARECKNLFALLKKELARESEVKLEIVFMPYKASMWDSLESIWLAAKEDERCNATVVPIPYYDRNPDRSFGAMHYEGTELPDYVPIIHYDKYDVSAHLPDVIYIHNPFDENNLITSVDPRFYSYNLKKHTDMLVYVPYFTSGAYANTEAFAQKHLTPALKVTDKIIVQSHTQKKLYMASGIKENKLLVLGTPKFDAIVNLDKTKVDVPTSWTEKIQDKKSIVLNSSIGSLLNNPEYLGELRNRISTILSFQELVLIWRPHPLLEATITSMRPDLYDEYKEIVHIVENSDNAVIDHLGSTLPATVVSDGMISDISSWARQYIATGKPVLFLNGQSELKKERIYVFDHFSSYFVKDGFSIEDFCKMVINGTDDKKEARMKDLRNSIVNVDGSCGQKTHERIVSLAE
ncbi:CDP-glycerol glycerophosphotransferase family protein [Brevibacillus sp. TJ4]|uniref:CDP-glycerol glycerophosphotransferase family protein n=1 Tax=Brevibacillus sp. TJ4 TaxID=3234853 RepID=UPI0037CF5C92